MTDVVLKDLIRNVLAWGKERGLHHGHDLRGQLIKLTEELGEIAAGVARNDSVRIADGVGDLLVVLINFGAIHSKSLGDYEVENPAPEDYLQICLGLAYNQIKDRTGSTVDGVFVKNDPS